MFGAKLWCFWRQTSVRPIAVYDVESGFATAAVENSGFFLCQARAVFPQIRMRFFRRSGEVGATAS